MKIRNGFVSNSSSSSFLIDNTKYSIDRVRQYIDSLVEAYNVINTDHITTDDICVISEVNRRDFYNRVDQFHGNTAKKDNKDTTKGILVDSTSDNSIPWDIQERLEEIAIIRQHWG